MTGVLLRAPLVRSAAGDLTDGWIAVRDGLVAGVGSGPVPPTIDGRATADLVLDRRDGTIVPGFVDLHAHGALGVDFASATAEGARRAAGHHAARGTTTLVASIATGTVPDTLEALDRLTPLVAEGVLGGLHLEGPWLSPARRGAHAPELLRPPDPGEFDSYLAAANGSLRVLTIAPELPGAEAVIERAVAAGVVVAVGHTDCDAATARRAIDAGARLLTHLFNGMPPLHHRDPGPVGVALADERVTVELIVDGHHLDAVTVALVRRAAADRIALVSDAMAATGCADGRYGIAGSEVVVADGVAMLADGSSLAGSTITVADAVARFRAGGATGREAVHASATIPATLLGSPPALTAGAPADALLLDPVTGLQTGVMRRGRWLS